MAKLIKTLFGRIHALEEKSEHAKTKCALRKIDDKDITEALIFGRPKRGNTSQSFVNQLYIGTHKICVVYGLETLNGIHHITIITAYWKDRIFF